ncbi:hypothetical protein [Streptacidiphilus sp. EB103A]|uniref:hypothetical protein n=1 Tax=Streptacidiphilus sp. EB103A TaxID=3156275 RepID=UPI003514D7CF
MQLAEADGLGLAEGEVEADAEVVDAGAVGEGVVGELSTVREVGVEVDPAVCEDDAFDEVVALGLAEAEAVAEWPAEALCEDEVPAAAPPVSAPLPEAEACGSELPATGALVEPAEAGAVLLSVVSASSPRPATASTPAVLSAITLVPRERLRRRPRRGAVARSGTGARPSAAEGSPYRATAVGSRITSSAVGRSPVG